MPFKPGNAGRPKGAKGKKRQMLESHSDEILKTLIDLAVEGDPTALRLCVDRLLPRLRAEAAPINVEAASSKIVDIGRSIVDAALSGRISSDSARDILSALSDVAKLKEITDIETRLKALEELDGGKPPWATSTGDDKPSAKELLPLRGKRRRSKT